MAREDLQTISARMGLQLGPEPGVVGLGPATILMLLQLLQVLIKCYLNRPGHRPGLLVRLCRLNGPVIRRWLRDQIEEATPTSAEFQALGGDRLVEEVRHELAKLEPETAAEVLHELAAMDSN